MLPRPLLLVALLARVFLVLTGATSLSAPASSPYPGEDQIAAASSLSDVELETGELEEGEDIEGEDEEIGDTRPDSQHLFPSFSALFPPLGHSRPAFFPAEGHHSRPPAFQLEPFRYNPRSSLSPVHSQQSLGGGGGGGEEGSNRGGRSSTSSDLLGSGNLGIIRGGTYYSPGESDSLRGPNAHSRPYRRPNPPPLYRSGGDFFEGFRDFADITTPTKGAFSEYVVVYANRKGVHPNPVTGPRNIMEQLELLDAEEKRSKNKKKLDSYKAKEKSIEQTKKTKHFPKQDLIEPLLALS